MPRWLPAAAVTLLAAAIAWLNRGETAALNLGFATFYRAPLTVILFLAFLAGMLSMLWLGLRQDLRMREELRARGILDIPARPAPNAPARTQPEETIVHADAPRTEVRSQAASEWARQDETIVRADAPSTTTQPPVASAWTQPEETVVRNDPPAEDRTVVYPRYDEDPAA